ncbi:hypothetical protein FPV67DRAFT_1559282 [Lyophyllum atratum]|nr:hypothetical protein FPV67DRAFT_1559282 [Lyophyllum atratum]
MSSSSPMPPLLGDGEGRYKVQVTGNSGTPFSTTGIALAELLDVPYISLDTLNWQPGWKETPTAEFQAMMREAMNQSDKGWVVDGSYAGKGGNIAVEECTDLIWLDPPLALYFPRILVRTFGRLFGLTAPCSVGCPESWREAFSAKGILWWCLSNHWATRRRCKAWMAEMGVVAGENITGRKMRRFGGWGSDVQIWMKDVAEMCRAK